LDLDFADIRTYPPHHHAGIVVLRLKSQDQPHVLSVLNRLIDKAFDVQPLAGLLWIVDERGLRIRGNPGEA